MSQLLNVAASCKLAINHRSGLATAHSIIRCSAASGLFLLPVDGLHEQKCYMHQTQPEIAYWSTKKKKNRKKTLVENAKKYQLIELTETIKKFHQQKVNSGHTINVSLSDASVSKPSQSEQGINRSTMSDSSKRNSLSTSWSENVNSFQKQIAPHLKPVSSKKKKQRKTTGQHETDKVRSTAKAVPVKNVIDLEKFERTEEVVSDEICDTLYQTNSECLHQELPEDGGQQGMMYTPVINDEFLDSHVVNNAMGSQKTKKEKDFMDLTVEDFLDKDKVKYAMAKLIKVVGTQRKEFIESMAQEALDKQRLEAFNKTLLCYVDVCISTGQVRKANSALASYYFGRKSKNKTISKGKRLLFSKVDIAIYNKVLHAWAKEGNIQILTRLFKQIHEIGLTPNLQSYAAALECIGRRTGNHVAMTQQLLEDMASEGLDVRRMGALCDLNSEQQLHVVKAIHTVDRNFRMDAKEALNNQSQPFSNPFYDIMSREQMQEKLKEQLRLETSNVVEIMSINQPITASDEVARARRILEETKKNWREILTKSFVREKEHARNQYGGMNSPNVYPYLCLLQTEEYVDIMMQAIDRVGQQYRIYSPPLKLLVCIAGREVFEKYNRNQCLSNLDMVTETYSTYLDAVCQKTISKNHRCLWLEAKERHNFDQKKLVKWKGSVLAEIGKFLLDIVIADIKITSNPFLKGVNQSEFPAIYKNVEITPDKRETTVLAHLSFQDLYEKADVQGLSFSPQEMPSLVPPIPWTKSGDGSNIMSTVDLVNGHNPCHEEMLKNVDIDHPGQYSQALDAINTVSSCPWKINKEVLDTAIEVFNSGGNPDIDIPPALETLPPIPSYPGSASIAKRREFNKKRAEIKKLHAETYSLRCTELYRLSIANQYRDEVFWYSYNMDFRGRIYGIPPHLNHIGNDLSRGLLLFGKGERLGPDGLKWLKIHLTNLTGFRKKHDNDDREAFADEMMEEIQDSADNPLNGRKWWMTSDSPWQTLACCMEITRAMRSPDPDNYISYFPVHQDGSCNGLQHYAALGRDEMGAKSVNLAWSMTPNDVYSDVLQLVEKARQKDEDCVPIAKALEGFLSRKVIKQTVMTSVYGVTYFGAMQQISKQLKDIPNFPKQDNLPAKKYIAEKVFRSLEQMFTSTEEIQNWLVLSADLFSRIACKPVSWTTPLGWPVAQDYYLTKDYNINGTKVLSIQPNRRKQMNAFPPNFIHSLDSSHMMLTALQCLQEGIAFVSVHDSFWTHARHIPTMSKVCREQFIALHGQPILENLAEGMQTACILPPQLRKPTDEKHSEELKHAEQLLCDLLGHVPKRGTFKLENVVESVFFFS